MLTFNYNCNQWDVHEAYQLPSRDRGQCIQARDREAFVNWSEARPIEAFNKVRDETEAMAEALDRSRRIQRRHVSDN